MYSKTQGLETRGPASAASPYLAMPQTQSKAACRPTSYMGSHTKNEIYPLGERRLAPQAGAWPYSRRGSGTDRQEGDASPLGGGPRM